jgi:hypothetical protein
VDPDAFLIRQSQGLFLKKTKTHPKLAVPFSFEQKVRQIKNREKNK